MVSADSAGSSETLGAGANGAGIDGALGANSDPHIVIYHCLIFEEALLLPVGLVILIVKHLQQTFAQL